MHELAVVTFLIFSSKLYMPTHVNASQNVALNNDTILNICVFDENPPAGARELNDFKRVRGSIAIAEEHMILYPACRHKG